MTGGDSHAAGVLEERVCGLPRGRRNAGLLVFSADFSLRSRPPCGRMAKENRAAEEVRKGKTAKENRKAERQKKSGREKR